MIVAGVMSGTSADGINVALLRITGQDDTLRFKLLGHSESKYPSAIRREILGLMNSRSASVAEISRLNFLLGELYADAVITAMRKHGVRTIDLAGCHGQTIYHQGEAANFLGKKIACTWQLGEGAVIAARLGTPVVSDFRPADMSAGGKGAPLVPFLDYLVYRHRSRGRILQNLGGIGNLSAIPAGSSPEKVIAFDTGPANMVIDACMERLYGKTFDVAGKVAASGKVDERVIAEILREPFFKDKPPKTAGREEFGREFVSGFMKKFGRARKEDVIATATALTARSIGVALRKFVVKSSEAEQYKDYVVAGGGAKNSTLLAMIEKEVASLGLKLRTSDEFGIPSAAKEAIAFAVMAYQTWHRRPSNIPSATGARRPAILGKISYV
jgi:anhydro-N-acetylmuramic acid kinase